MTSRTDDKPARKSTNGAPRISIVSIEEVSIGDLKPFPGNPRRGDLVAIKASIETSGQYRAIVANKRTKQVLAGNHVYLAMRELGAETVMVGWVDVDEDDAKRIVAADNRLSDLGTYDPEDLAALLSSMPDLEGTGYEPADVDKLLAELNGGDDEGGSTEPQLGDVEYRLLIRCEDEGHQAELLDRFTSEGLKVQALAQ